MKPLSFLAALALALAAGGCDVGQTPDSQLAVSVIGSGIAPADPSAGPLDPARRTLMDATAQGLVRFDGAGGIEPGLAERWIVIDDGRSYIFRLREAEWPDGTPVTSEQVVRVLKRAAAQNRENALAPFLAVIDEIVAMTDTVIEVRLKSPRPDLLKLFAQPEMAVFRTSKLDGSGPYRLRADTGGGALLYPTAPPGQHGSEDPALDPRGSIRLRGERAALAIARFKDGHADLVLGGSFADWPILAVADVPQAAIRTDPALGMFGLVLLRREGFLAEATNRAVIAMALDRAALTQAFRPDWAPVETLLPAQLDSAAAPAIPSWSQLPLDARRESARTRTLIWRRTHDGPPEIRIALPPGPGASMVWVQIARALIAVDIHPVRVAMGEPADLALIDAVAPYDSARWFLANACRACSPEVAALVDAARDAPTLDARARAIAAADAALTADSAYIPIAQPLRWSIVTSRITAWQGNTRAWHPLNHLRNEGE